MLDYPDEFLTSVYGSYGTVSWVKFPKIRSLTFLSNKNTYGPFGFHESDGTLERRTFSIAKDGSKIVRFHAVPAV